MKIVTAIDSFKGSMTSMEAGLAVTEGVHRVDSDVDVQIRPLADGGGRSTCCRNEWHETGDSGDGTTWNTGSL